jgi:hypothetical protein
VISHFLILLAFEFDIIGSRSTTKNNKQQKCTLNSKHRLIMIASIAEGIYAILYRTHLRLRNRIIQTILQERYRLAWMVIMYQGKEKHLYGIEFKRNYSRAKLLCSPCMNYYACNKNELHWSTIITTSRCLLCLFWSNQDDEFWLKGEHPLYNCLCPSSQVPEWWIQAQDLQVVIIVHKEDSKPLAHEPFCMHVLYRAF